MDMINGQISAALTGECFAKLNVDGATLKNRIKEMTDDSTLKHNKKS